MSFKQIHATTLMLASLTSLFATSSWAQAAPKYAAKVPASVTTPDTVQTRIGTLKFTDGAPDEATVQKAYDQLDFGRGVEAFLAGIPATSVYALCEGFKEAGFPANEGIGITETLADARALFLTPNSTVVYVWFCADAAKEPMVVHVPPGVLGMIDDAYFRYITDLGLPGPDQGKGGKYLVVPPGYKGDIAERRLLRSPSRAPTPTSSSFVHSFRTVTSRLSCATSRRTRGCIRCLRRAIRRRRSS